MSKDYLSGSFCFRTDIGKVRLNNEDRAVGKINEKGEVLLMVLDGMGGENKGDLASSLALETILKDFEEKGHFNSYFDVSSWMKKTIKKANRLIYQESLKDISNHGMGTTLTMIILRKNVRYIAQIGDSRAYQIKANKLELMTEDQSYVAYLYRTGQIKKEEMLTHPERHVLLNALGVYPSTSIDFSTNKYNGETLLLCSDGLYNNLPDSTIESILKSDDSVDQKCTQCISIANHNGGSDNIAVVIWEANK